MKKCLFLLSVTLVVLVLAVSCGSDSATTKDVAKETSSVLTTSVIAKDSTTAPTLITTAATTTPETTLGTTSDTTVQTTTATTTVTITAQTTAKTAEVTTLETTAPQTTTTQRIETTAAPVTEAEPEVKSFALLFTETNLCSSRFDPKSNYQEGGFSNWDRWYSTDYVDLEGCYALYYTLSAHKYLMSLSFYDEGKNYISGVGTTSTSDGTTVNGFITVPENAVYARFITFVGINTSVPFDEPVVNGYPTKADYEAATAEYPHHNLKIACIGDSLTEGDYGSFAPGTPNVHYANYPYYLAKMLGCTTVNFGKCGWTAEMMLNAYRSGSIDITDADVIFIMLGTNYGLKTNGNTQYNAYITLLNMISRQMKDGAQIILITPPHASNTKPTVSNAYREFVREASATVLEIAKDKSLPVFDAHNESPIQEETENVYQPIDGLHMNKSGYRAFAAYIADELVKFLATK